MSKKLTRIMALLLAVMSVFGLISTGAQAAAPNTIKLENFGYSNVSYRSDVLGTCSLHEMFFDYNGTSTIGFCGDHRMGMGTSLIGQKWTRAGQITDPTVLTFLAYYYGHMNGEFTDEAISMGLNTSWNSYLAERMNMLVQAIIWRYVTNNFDDPLAAAAEEWMYLVNSIENANYTSIDDLHDGVSFRSEMQYIIGLGEQGVWGDCTAYMYNFSGSGSAEHPAGTVQRVVIGELNITNARYNLTVKKIDADNPNVGLAGARFHIESSNGAFIKDVVTGADGTVTISELPADTYAVTETGAPEGYEIDDAGPKYVVLPSAGGETTVTVTFSDSKKITSKGTIRKVDADNPTKGLAGAVIKIEGVDNAFVGTYTTGADGYLENVPWEEMSVGTYTATEITPPGGYTLSSDPDMVKQEFHWDGSTDVTLVFTDHAKVRVQLIKQSEDGKPLPGALFNVLRDGQIVMSAVTDENGTITVSDVTEGLYAFVEVAAPEGYAKIEKPVYAYVDNEVVTNGGTVTVTAKDLKLPGLTIKKQDKDTGEPVPGTVFTVKGIRFGYTTEVTTGKDGTATLTDIPADSYEITEKSVPEPYILNEENSKSIWLDAGKSSTLVFENSKKPELIIEKQDAKTGKPIANTVFTLSTDGKVIGDYTTGEDGTVTISKLDPGAYTVTEKSVPDGYILDTTPQTVTLEAGKTGKLLFKNNPKPELEIKKLDSITGDPIKGAKFQIWYSPSRTTTGELNDLGTFTTDENGRFAIEKADEGWYKITELEPAPGYAIKEPATQEVFVKGGEDKTVTFENTPLSALVIWKYDSVTGKAVEGATFQVRYLSGVSGTGGTVIGTYKTSANGAITITGLKTGTYVVEETAAPDGYVIDTAPQTAYISGNEQAVIELYFGNAPDGSLLVKKVDAVTGKPLAGIEFMVTTSEGTVVGDANGKFATDSAGTILVDGVEPGTTLVVKETRTLDGYVLDDSPQTVRIKAGRTVTLEFRNQPEGDLIIVKKDSVTGKPLEGVTFKITYSNGKFVDNIGGKLSSNGLYYTDKNGQIHICGVTGTLVVTEVKTIKGYVIDENTRTQTVVVNPDDTQTLTFYNDPIGNVEIIKVSSVDSGKRLSGVTFEIRKVGGELIDTVTTSASGRVSVSLEAGAYYAVEIETADGYRLDSAPHYFRVKNGETTTLTIKNEPTSSLLIHKVDSVTGKGIYGVSFIIYDSGRNPVDQITTDQSGYAYADETLKSGRYYIRELEPAEGYLADTQYKTVYVRAGETTTVEWENTPVTAQIQITKYAKSGNPINGDKAGERLEGAVFEIASYRSGKVVGYITTDERGVAASDPLPLGRYIVSEVKAPAYYTLSDETFDIDLEFAGQIVRLAVYDDPVELSVSIRKTGITQVLAGSNMTYRFTVANTSNVALQNFYWHDRIPTDFTRAMNISTGTYSDRLTYRVLYKTNYNDYRVLASNLLSTKNYAFSLNALPLMEGEVVTDIYYDFGTVPAGFESIAKPTLTVSVGANVNNGSYVINRADAGGKYQGTWETDNTAWVTIVRKLTPTPTPTLPKTGY